MADTFRQVDGRDVYWRDGQGLVHAAEGSDVHPGVRLLWTLCERDIPANEAYTMRDGKTELVTCPGCLAAAGGHDG